jgi:hypothetical protein
MKLKATYFASPALPSFKCVEWWSPSFLSIIFLLPVMIKTVFNSTSILLSGYPESNFRFHVEHEVVGAARRGCTAV